MRNSNSSRNLDGSNEDRVALPRQACGDNSTEVYLETRTEWKPQIRELQLELAAIVRAEPGSIDDALRIPELPRTAYFEFKMTSPEQNRELLEFCSRTPFGWKGNLN